jgi:pimeloyl-ACP methyl ester carboxylesterase
MANLFIRETGTGTPVILLHGFPFHSALWSSFADKLSAAFKVYAVDLPGFGKSQILPSPFTIDQVASRVVSWLEERRIKNPVIVGHSLGGYVALAMIKRSPNLASGLVLFHSTALADTEEKKQSRDKVLEFIDKNGVVAFTSNFIAPLFADPAHPAIAKVKAIATESSAEAVKGYTSAMRDRHDLTDVLSTFKKPVLFLAGEKDGGIPVESIYKQAAISPFSETQVLSGVAHMGMLEDEKTSFEIVRSFIDGSTVTK